MKYFGCRKIYLDKLFSCPPSKHFNNLMIDQESVSYITTPLNSDIITTIIESHIPDHIYPGELCLFDATACVGGDTITFAKLFGTVIASEIRKDRCDMLINNLNEFELYNVIPINEDCLKVYEKVNFIDIMYFDPPWGGKNYKDEKELKLSIGNVYIEDIINNIFEGRVRSDVKIIALKLPKNYNLLDLYEKTKRDTVTIYLYELQKMLILIYKKNNYC
jgi:hypothetical protein